MKNRRLNKSLCFFFGVALFSAAFSCSAKESIIIGIDADMSSVAADGGNAIYRGAKIAIDEINTAGGILGRPLELVVKDHRGNPARGLQNLKAFNQEPNLAAVVGGVHTPVVLNELEYINQNQILFLVPWAAGTPIVENGFDPNFVFRVSVRDSEAASVLLREAKQRGLTRVALVLERTGWGRSNLQSLSQAAPKFDIEVVDVAWINWRQTTFIDEIQQIVASGAEGVVLVANAPEGAVVLRDSLENEMLSKVPFISHWGIAAGNFVDELGLQKLRLLDLHVLQTFHFALPEVDQAIAQRVLSAYSSQFDSAVTKYTMTSQVGVAHAYDLVHMLAKAIQQAQSIEPNAVRQALKELKSHKGLLKTYSTPFVDSNDALWAEDYIMARYNDDGFLVPKQSTK
ncbi:ABC transporter substrate-binding protein [Alteromonas facilis]|uniref:ABC transporter substrate-binding protein n=1 Tax=Alteromonas facilis TaxID=2048004 RepID=UPI000C294995|nr:ABC transporter substrate-binding protein [Alteromonas facilis]